MFKLRTDIKVMFEDRRLGDLGTGLGFRIRLRWNKGRLGFELRRDARNIQVATGRKTVFERLSNDGRTVVGLIVTADNAKGVPTGTVIVTVASDPARVEEYLTIAVPVKDAGFFARVPNDRWKMVRAEYLGETGYGPCVHDWVDRR